MGKAELRIEIDADVLADARAAGVALGDAAEIGLRLAIAEAQEEAVRTHNERVAARGIFGEDLRRW